MAITKQTKRRIASLEQRVRILQDAEKYWKSRWEIAVAADEASKNAAIAAKQREIDFLLSRAEAFFAAKANEDVRFESLFNSALQTAIATKPDVRS